MLPYGRCRLQCFWTKSLVSCETHFNVNREMKVGALASGAVVFKVQTWNSNLYLNVYRCLTGGVQTSSHVTQFFSLFTLLIPAKTLLGLYWLTSTLLSTHSTAPIQTS